MKLKIDTANASFWFVTIPSQHKKNERDGRGKEKKQRRNFREGATPMGNFRA